MNAQGASSLPGDVTLSDVPKFVDLTAATLALLRGADRLAMDCRELSWPKMTAALPGFRSALLLRGSQLRVLSLRLKARGWSVAELRIENWGANLESLGLSGSELNGKEAQALNLALSRCTNLHDLNLSSSKLGGEGAKALAPALAKCAHLQSLNLADNGLSAADALALSPALESCAGLRVLNLTGNVMLQSQGVKALAAALSKCAELRELRLGPARMDTSGAQALGALLQTCTKIETFRLSAGIMDPCDPGKCRALGTGLAHCAFLRHLHLPNNNMGEKGIRALVPGLTGLCSASLQDLDLSFTRVGGAGAQALGPALEACTNLESFRFECNNVGDEGARALASALARCSKLRLLNLADNGIGAEGAKALAPLLKGCTQLEKLILDSNKMGDEAAAVLCAGLENCTKLRVLQLRSVGMGDPAAVALASALEKRPHQALEWLLLSKNPEVGDAGLTALAWALRGSTRISRLWVAAARIGPEGAQALASLINVVADGAQVYLAISPLQDQVAATFAEALVRRGPGRSIQLGFDMVGGYCSCGEAGMRAFAAALPCLHPRSVVGIPCWGFLVRYWNRAKSEAPDRRAVYGFLAAAASSASRGGAAHAFVRRDGDAAMLRRVLGMLVITSTSSRRSRT